MKVLMVAPGESTHSQRVLSWLLNNGVSVYFCDPINPYTKEKKNYFYISYPRRGTRTIRKVFGSKLGDEIAYRMAENSLRRIYKMVEPDIVHVLQIDHRAYQCMRAGMKPLILTAWGSDINCHFIDHADRHFRGLIGETLKKADYIFVDAPNLIENCFSLAGQRVPIELLSLGVNTRLFHSGYTIEAASLRDKLGIPKDARVLLSPRNLIRMFRHDVILEAFSGLINGLKEPIYLVYKLNHQFPETNKIKVELQNRAKVLGIDQYIRFIDQIPYEQMPLVYSIADFVVNFPIMDGFPVTFLEAAVCERPVITNKLPAYLDTFAEKCFYMFDDQTEDGLTRLLITAFTASKAEITSRTDDALKIVKQRFDENYSIQRLLEVYETIAGEK
jgi:L-malate glycosyltransferase